jgi:hypothetical protein
MKTTPTCGNAEGPCGATALGPAGGELSGAAIGAAFRRERYARRTFCTRRSPGEPHLPLEQLVACSWSDSKKCCDKQESSYRDDQEPSNRPHGILMKIRPPPNKRPPPHAVAMIIAVRHRIGPGTGMNT